MRSMKRLKQLQRLLTPEANIIFGAVIDDSLQDELRGNRSLHTGFDDAKPREQTFEDQ